ncbi:MAG: cyclohexadienyl dehydratase [Alphaproteobacteria bacterium]|nr:cyclohexadienyl dehydratase [Alphaproteobacteria bacterium]
MRTGTIKCGYSPWPMYWDVDPNTKELSGLVKDLSDATFKLLGLKVEYVEYVFSNKVIDLQSGRIDAICGDGPWILTTIKQIDYSAPYYFTPVFAYARADETRFLSRSDLDKPGIQFVGIDGDLSTELVQNNFPLAKLNTLTTTADAGQMLLDVSTKKADATIIDPAAATNFITHNPGKVKQLFNGKMLGAYNNGFSVKKGETDLLNMLNGAVAAMHNTGAVDPILDRYDPKGEKFLKVQPGFIIK